MTQLARVFRALADPTRLRILNILSHQSACVCELQEVLGLSQPFVSRHLAYLRRAGLVQDRREGARICYSVTLATPLAPGLGSFLLEVLSPSQVGQSDMARLAEHKQPAELQPQSAGMRSSWRRAA